MTKKTLIPIVGADYINKSNRDYAIYTAQNRAIPSAWDGVKDGNRKALYVLKNKNKEIKTISLAGEMISAGIYLHGDAAAAGAINNMAAFYKNNVPLIAGIGNFGTIKQPDAVGAPRYTYVKKNKLTSEVFYRDFEIVPMKENYDGSEMEPVHFLPIIPLAILNGIEGMAMGFSTNILPHSLEDIIQCTLDVLDGKMPKILPRYDSLNLDYPTVLDVNKYEFLGKVQIVDSSNICITALPPNCSVEKMMGILYALEEESNSPIKNIINNSKTDVNITVTFTKNFCKGWSESDAIEYFKLYKRDTQRLVMIDWDNSSVRTFSCAEEYIIEFVENRFNYYIKRYENLLREVSYKLQQWNLIKKCYDDNLPGQLKSFKSKKDLVKTIDGINKKHSCNADDKQIDAVAGLPTYRWVQDNYQEVLDKIVELEDDKNYYEALLDDHDSIWQIFRDEVQALQSITFETGREEA